MQHSERPNGARRKENNMYECLKPIIMHADVSRSLDAYGREKLLARGLNLDAFRPLQKLREVRKNHLAARRNAREEFAAASKFEERNGTGSAYDAGFSVDTQPMSEEKIHLRLNEALKIGGLPNDLKALIEAYIAGK